MQLPYVSSPERAFLTAQVATASVLTVMVWSRPTFPRRASVLLLFGMWLAALAAPEVAWLAGSGIPLPSHVKRLDWVLGVSSLLIVAAMVVRGNRRGALVAAFGAWGLDQIGRYVVASDDERAALQLVFGGLLYGIARPTDAPSDVSARRFAPWEIGLFAIGVSAATVVAVYVLDRFVASGDEWAYQYQADLFGHGKVYGPVPDCPTLHMTYWIYYWKGRAFSQYTPSWPLVLAPFQRLGVYWLANPVVFGLLMVGVSRLARRAAGEGPAGLQFSREARAAGIVAPVALCGSGAMLLNAGSLFSHNLVCALFAWTAELLFVVTSPGPESRRTWFGFLLGGLAALLLGTRPGDGGALLLGMSAYAVYALVKRTLTVRAALAGVAGLVLVGGFILVILRIQLGEWFRSGYSLTEVFNPWGTVAFGWPQPDEWKYGIPLATGAYCFFPCSAAVAAVGIVMAYRRSRRVPLVLGSGALFVLALYSAVTQGRHTDWGYGPRYVLAVIVPLAVFTGVALAPMFARISSLKPGPIFRAVTVASAMLVGTWIIGGLLYPVAMREVRLNGAPFRAIKEAKLTNAVVVFPPRAVAQDPTDLTQNLASEKNPDVIYLIERAPEDMECGRRLYPRRKWYRAMGFEQVRLIPLY